MLEMRKSDCGCNHLGELCGHGRAPSSAATAAASRATTASATALEQGPRVGCMTERQEDKGRGFL